MPAIVIIALFFYRNEGYLTEHKAVIRLFCNSVIAVRMVSVCPIIHEKKIAVSKKIIN